MNMKRYISLLICLMMVLGTAMPSFALHDSVNAGQISPLNRYGWIDDEGGLHLWGDNAHGQAGQDKSVQFIREPKKIMDNVMAFDRGQQLTIVLKTDGTAWTFGKDFHHGYEYLELYRDYWHAGDETPYKVGDDVVAVSIGNEEQIGMLKKDGTLWTWGLGTWSDLGYNVAYLDDEYFMQEGQSYPNGVPATFKSCVVKPKQIMDGVKSFAMGQYNGMAIKNDNSLWYWGNYGDPTLKVDPDAEIPGPTKLLDNVKQFSIGWNGFVTGVVMTNGQAYYWGQATPAGTVGFKNRKKFADNVAKIAAYVDDSADYSNNNQFYVLKTDGKLYAKNGSEFIMDDVADVFYGVGSYELPLTDEDCPDRTFILKKDGTLIQRMTVRDEAHNFAGWNDKVIATGVALPTQPVSSLRAKVKPFEDVYKDYYYGDAVQWAKDHEPVITDGVTPTQFAPAKTVTRGQAVTFLWRAMGEPEPESSENPFADVAEGAYYCKPVLWALENGITDGTSDTTFSPDSPVKRGQMITFLWRAMGEPGKTGEGAWYQDAENWASGKDLLSGTAGAYTTSGACPRADVVYYLWEVMGRD